MTDKPETELMPLDEPGGPVLAPPAPLPAAGQLDRILGTLEHMVTQDGMTLEMVREITGTMERCADRLAKQAFYAAMAAFHEECPPIPRTHQNAQFKRVNRNGVTVPSTYADLETMGRIVIPVAAKHGLTLGWGDAVVDERDWMTMTGILTHGGGHRISITRTIPVEKSAAATTSKSTGAQIHGCHQAYLQRMLFVGLFGLTTCDEDLDGQAPSGPVKTITQDQVQNLNDLLIQACEGTTTTADDQRSRMLAKVRVAKMADIPADKLADLTATLQAQLRERKVTQ